MNIENSIVFFDLFTKNPNASFHDYERFGYKPVYFKFHGRNLKRVETGKILLFIHPEENYNDGYMVHMVRDFENKNHFIPERKKDNHIQFSIATKNMISNKPNIIKDIIEKVSDIFTKKFNQKLMLVSDVNEYKRLKYSSKNIQKVYDRLKENQVECIAVSEWLDNYYSGEIKEDEYGDCSVSLEFSLKTEETNIPDCVTVSFAYRVLEKFKKDETQNLILELFNYIFEKIDGINGYITDSPSHGFIKGYTYIDNTHYDSPLQASEHFDENVRGYFWGNMLTDKHIEKLGGIENIKEKATCFSVIDMSNNEKQQVFIQLSENIFDYPNERLSELREYLLPIFPPLSEKRKAIYKQWELDQIKRKGEVIRALDIDLL